MFKKSLLIMLLMAMFVPWAANAQTPSVTIGSGTATSAYLPTRSYNKYTISQQIYTAEEINASGTITSISFYRTDANTGTNNSRKFDIYMAHTTKSEFTSTVNWEALTDANIVYNGTTAIAQPQNQWYAFTLDTPFAYNGTDNLIVVVIDRSGEYSAYNADNTYRVFSTGSSYQAMYATADSYSSLNPNGTNNTTSLTGTRSTSKNQIVLGGIQQTCAKPTGLTATLDDTDHTIAALSWTENGEATSWVLQYGPNNDFSDATTVNVSNTPSKDLTGLTPETTYYARVRPSCSETLWSDVCEFEPTNAIGLTIYNNGGSNTNQYAPIYGYYGDTQGTISQFIIPATKLTDVIDGTINKLTFYCTNESLTMGEFEIRLEEVEEDEFESATLHTWGSGAVLVKTAYLNIANNQLSIVFSTPFEYHGGNLMIGTHIKTKASDTKIYWNGENQSKYTAICNKSSVARYQFIPQTTSVH